MTAAPLPLYDVQRQCACGRQWRSQSFTPVAEGEVRTGSAKCPVCLAADEAHLAALVRRAPPVPRPTPVRATREREPGEDAPEPWWNR